MNHNLLWYPFPFHNSGSFEWTFLVSHSFARKLILGLCMVPRVKSTIMCAKMSCPLRPAFTPTVAPDLGHSHNYCQSNTSWCITPTTHHHPHPLAFSLTCLELCEPSTPWTLLRARVYFTDSHFLQQILGPKIEFGIGDAIWVQIKAMFSQRFCLKTIYVYIWTWWLGTQPFIKHIPRPTWWLVTFVSFC